MNIGFWPGGQKNNTEFVVARYIELLCCGSNQMDDVGRQRLRLHDMHVRTFGLVWPGELPLRIDPLQIRNT